MDLGTTLSAPCFHVPEMLKMHSTDRLGERPVKRTRRELRGDQAAFRQSKSGGLTVAP